MEVREYIRVSGLVQCVGFRWFTQQHASRLGLTGWVRNLEDGDVELEVQGESDNVDAFTGEVAHGPRYARVDHIEARGLAVDPKERSFRIKEDLW